MCVYTEDLEQVVFEMKMGLILCIDTAIKLN